MDYFNGNFAGKSELDQRCLVERVKSLEQDLKQALAYIEVMADLLSNNETPNNV